MRTNRHPALIQMGQQIRKIRQEKGFSQESFAAEAGLGRSYFGGVERGDHNIAALNLMRIAATLEIEVGELFPSVRTFSRLIDKSTDVSEDK